MPATATWNEMHDHEEQFGFELGETGRNAVYSPNLAEIREDLNGILDEARSATNTAPWDARTMRYNKIVFPQMANWLPEEERDQLRFEFAQEIERLKNAA